MTIWVILLMKKSTQIYNEKNVKIYNGAYFRTSGCNFSILYSTGFLSNIVELIMNVIHPQDKSLHKQHHTFYFEHLNICKNRTATW